MYKVIDQKLKKEIEDLIKGWLYSDWVYENRGKYACLNDLIYGLVERKIFENSYNIVNPPEKKHVLSEPSSQELKCRGCREGYKSHSCCFEQENPPCGLKSHARCCLCECRKPD